MNRAVGWREPCWPVFAAMLAALTMNLSLPGQEVRTAKTEEPAAQNHLPQRPVRSVTPPSLTPADLDRMVASYLKQTDPRVEPATLTSDGEFLRRVQFDLAGTPPTPAQVLSFVKDHAGDKRARRIDALLQSPEYARNWAHYWKDVIRFHATNQNPQQIRYDALEDWLTEQFRKNRPWDEIAADLITATGRVDENGAASFALAHEAKPVELAGEVSRIFMGVQIQCAQCHDHKTDSWKRQQFHEFAAFFSGTRMRPVIRGMPGQLPVFEVQVQGRPRYAMPDLENPNKRVPVAPRFFLAAAIADARVPLGLDTVARRALGASYITGQDNPWFARAFVNRMWYALMGDSFYEAVDDLGPERKPKAPELIETLAQQWQQGGYDIRWLLRTITLTNAYQRRARGTNTSAGKTSFAASCPGRLRSDQIAAALSEALGLPVDLAAVPTAAMDRRPGNRGPLAAQAADRGQGKGKNKPLAVKKAIEAAGLGSAPTPGKGQGKAMRLGGPRNAFNNLFGIDPSTPVDEIVGTIPQALFLMNAPMIHNRTQARPGTVLGEILATAPGDRAALNRLFLRVLSRPPTARELEACSAYMDRVGNRVEVFEDIYWALINSTEFISRR